MQRATGLIELGVKAYSAGRLEEAASLWRQALEVSPDDPRARAYLEALKAPAQAPGARPSPASEARPAAAEPPPAKAQAAAPVEVRTSAAVPPAPGAAPPAQPAAPQVETPRLPAPEPPREEPHESSREQPRESPREPPADPAAAAVPPPSTPPSTSQAPSTGPASAPSVEPREAASPARKRFSVDPSRPVVSGTRSFTVLARRRLILALVALAVLAVATVVVTRAARDGTGRDVLARGAGAVSAAWSRLMALPPEAARLAREVAPSWFGPAPEAPDPSRPSPGPVAHAAPRPKARGAGTVEAGPDSVAEPAPASAPGPLARVAPGARWGMTLEEVLEATPSARRMPDSSGAEDGGLEAKARASRWELRGRPYQADFLFDGSDRLGGLRLRSAAGARAAAVFGDLASALTADMGEPSRDERGAAKDGSWHGQARWVTSKATVDLEGWTYAPEGVRVFEVDVRKGGIAPVRDGEVVLTLRARPSGDLP